MTAFVGMDVEQVEKLGNDLRSQAERIDEIGARIDDLIRQMATVWRGSDAERFADWWSGQHRPALRAVFDAIEGLARSAKNNAEDQTRASGAGSASTHGSANATIPISGDSADPANPGLPSAPSATGAAAVNSFVASYQGKGIDVDGRYGNQCVDLFNLYNREVVGGPFIGTPVTGGARDLYEAFPASADAYYEKVPADQPAQPGDVAVWGATSGNQYGHVAMVVSADPNALQVIQQNGFNPNGSAFVGGHSYNGLLGYLRPRTFEDGS